MKQKKIDFLKQVPVDFIMLKVAAAFNIFHQFWDNLASHYHMLQMTSIVFLLNNLLIHPNPNKLIPAYSIRLSRSHSLYTQGLHQDVRSNTINDFIRCFDNLFVQKYAKA